MCIRDSRWELTAEPYAVYNCHCRMCQKAHGAAFGTYCFVKPEQLRWSAGADAVRHYRSSEALVRSHCDRCGSVVPYSSQARDHWVAPGGCHDTMRRPDCNIFIADKAPWHTVSGGLPECAAYPDGSDMPSVPGVPAPQQTAGRLNGSCLCGAVAFEVTEPFRAAYNCHCGRCRRARAAAHATNGFMSCGGVRFVRGAAHLKSCKAPGAQFFTQVFCELCGSPLPRQDAARDLAAVPFGALDHDPKIRPASHIYVAYKAGWHDITDDLPQFAAGPGSR